MSKDIYVNFLSEFMCHTICSNLASEQTRVQRIGIFKQFESNSQLVDQFVIELHKSHIRKLGEGTKLISESVALYLRDMMGNVKWIDKHIKDTQRRISLANKFISRCVTETVNFVSRESFTSVKEYSELVKNGKVIVGSRPHKTITTIIDKLYMELQLGDAEKSTYTSVSNDTFIEELTKQLAECKSQMDNNLKEIGDLHLACEHYVKELNLRDDDINSLKSQLVLALKENKKLKQLVQDLAVTQVSQVPTVRQIVNPNPSTTVEIVAEASTVTATESSSGEEDSSTSDDDE